MNLKEWWANQSTTDKAVYGLSAFCICTVLYMALAGLLVPDITSLSLDKNNLEIDDKSTQLILKGHTDPNAAVFISSSKLNLNRVPIAVRNDGNFEYNLNIPVEVAEAKISISSKAPKKYEVSQDINVQRPITYLSLEPLDKLNYGSTQVLIEGRSDPDASINIVSNMTLRNNFNLQNYIETAFNDPVINNLTLKADSNGYFKHEFSVPLNSSSASFNITAKSTGKREAVQVQNVTPYFEAFPPVYTMFDQDSNSSKMEDFSGKGFSISYPNIWQKRSYKNAGKDARLYLIYGNSVECIVWYGQIGKEFGKSLDDYRLTQDHYLRAWWKGTEVFQQTVNYGDVKGFRTVYRCQQNPMFSNDVPAPFYIDRTTLTKNNKDVYELQLIVEAQYYEKNDYILEKTVQSFNLK
ncbi:hypothetical protein [Methanobacterium sp. ACI-7]|uniref:hypothetical protein n=1 Tax=unclassified Methanobacterium TaxID=2627676 RepID=UPI0039C225AB